MTHDTEQRIVIERGALIEQTDSDLNVYGVGMTDREAVQLVLAYAQAVQNTKGMTQH